MSTASVQAPRESASLYEEHLADLQISGLTDETNAVIVDQLIEATRR
jgi:hypothetical protein